MLTMLAANKPPADDPAQAAAYDFWTALAFYELGKWSQALECIRDYEKKYPASPYQPRVLRLQAWSCMKLGRQDEAIACLTKFADRYGNSPEGPANLLDGAKALIAAGNLETARTVLEKLVALDLADRVGQEGRSLLGWLYFSEKKWAAARQTVLPLIDQRNVPDQWRAAAFFCLADIAEAQSNLVASLRLLENSSEKIGDPALKREINLRKGKIFLQMGKINEGVSLVRGYVAAQSTNAVAREVHLQLAETLLARGLSDRALREFQNYLETFSNPDGVFKANLGKGWALLNLGRPSEAAAAFESAAAGAPLPADSAYCRFKMADCQFAGEQYKLAAESYLQISAQFPDTDLAEKALFQAAECRARLGNVPEAEIMFLAVADRDGAGPLGMRALLRIAELRQQQGAEAHARAVYQVILAEGDPAERARALLGIAFLDYRLGRFPEALAGFQALGQYYPASEVADLAFFMGGWCQVRLGRLDLAAGVFRDFIQRYPRSDWVADACFWLAEQDFNRGQFQPAELAWARLAADYPKAAAADKALFWAGRAALQQNEFRRAKDYFSLLIKNYPASERRAEARFYQGQALGELDEFAGMIVIMDEIIKQFPESELAEAAWMRKGDSQFTLGAEDPKRYDEAIKSYQQILDAPKARPVIKMQAAYKLGRCHEKAGRAQEAFEHYMKVVYSYFEQPELKPEGNVWFTRAAFNAAEIKESEKSWRKAVAIYQRVVEAGVPASRDAQARIDKIRADYWMYFY
jgi:TolA-binding protein